jgi:predicted dehydrogenase
MNSLAASLSRRRFLEEALLAAAGAAGAEMLPRAAAGQGEPSRSPNERLSVAVLGVRNRGQDHARAFAARGDCEVTCICDADQRIGGALCEKLEGPGHRRPRFVQDLRKVLNDRTIDVVSVATPNHWHALAAIWAMQAGKDVYVEKPVSHNIVEGRRMVEVARKHGRICQGGTQYRSVAANREAAKFVQEGGLGKLRLARTVTYRLRKSIGPPGQYPLPPGVDYNLWAGPAPMNPVTRKSFHYDWHWFWDYGSGEIGNNNIHCIDLMRLLTGITGLGRGVMSYGGRQFHDAGQTASTQVAIHDYGELTVVQEVRNLKTPEPRLGASVLVTGSEGYLAASDTVCTVFDPAGKRVRRFDRGGQDHFANFIQAVRSRKREDLNAEIAEGHQSAAMIHVANISYRLGRPTAPAEIVRYLESLRTNENALETFAAIQEHLAANEVDIAQEPLVLGPWLPIDAEKESFVDVPAAAAMLSREYRKPFVLPEA